MKLTDLDPHWVKCTGDGHSQIIEDMAAADGIVFLCPRCYEDNGGRVGTHIIFCWFQGKVPLSLLYCGPGRWNPSGTGYADLTFVGPGLTSVLIQGGCNAHFHIVNGEIRHC